MNQSDPVIRTADDNDDEPGVMGAGHYPPPMPTIEEAYRAQYMLRFIEKGFAQEDAEACFDPPYDDMTPQEAADEDMSYFEDDGDGPID